MKYLASVTAIALSSAGLAIAGETPAPPGAQAYIVSPSDGAVAGSPVTIVFGLKGMGVAPAGIEKKNTGHHHLLIDTGMPPSDEPIDSDEKHRHFGGGQTETSIIPAPGKRTLQLLLGDWSPFPHNPPVASETITITVK